MLSRCMVDPQLQNLHLTRADAVATLTLDRPKALNALDAATLRELARAIRELRRDGGVRALIVTGAGDKAFSAGADIAAMAAMSAADGHAYSRLGHEVLARLEALAILIVAAEKARLGQPEINLGLIPGFGGTQRLVRRIGQTRARELIYLGHMVAAEEALRLGLVNRVVPHERLAEEAAKLAAELAAKAPVALAQAKRATAIAADADLETGCRFEVEAFGVTFATGDRVEGLKAFLEKRTPAWKGR